MSYNIGTVQILTINATIKRTDAFKLWHSGETPEGCFLEYAADSDSEDVKLTDLNWYGEGSGRSWDFFKKKVVPKIKGTAECIVIWEDGDSTSGFSIKDGKYQEHEVVMTLGKPIKG